MASRFGEGHAILPPPVELRDTPPALVRDMDSAAARLVGLAVGMIGRNWGSDPPGDEQARFLQRVAASAGSLKLYDAGRWRYGLGGEASIRFCSRQDARLELFLDSLDCLLVCPAPWWLEEEGRAIFSSMAGAVPAIVPTGSIFAEYINHGVDGLLYESFDDAVRQLSDLRRAPARIAGLRHAARAKIAQLADPMALTSAVRQIAFGRSIEPDAQRLGPPQRSAMAPHSPMRRTP
jgi:glycosyltransferase involved in cell wall biosynthesis